MKKSRVILFVILAAVVIAVGVGVAMYFKPHKNFAGATPDFQLTASELVGVFSADEVGATAKFVADDKVVLVSGVIREIETDERGATVLVLAPEELDGSVACTLTAEESAASGTVRIGDFVRITGQCTGMQGLIEPQVILIRCGLVLE
jgi:hypothetical protein